MAINDSNLLKKENNNKPSLIAVGEDSGRQKKLSNNFRAIRYH